MKQVPVQPRLLAAFPQQPRLAGHQRRFVRRQVQCAVIEPHRLAPAAEPLLHLGQQSGGLRVVGLGGQQIGQQRAGLAQVVLLHQGQRAEIVDAALRGPFRRLRFRGAAQAARFLGEVDAHAQGLRRYRRGHALPQHQQNAVVAVQDVVHPALKPVGNAFQRRVPQRAGKAQRQFAVVEAVLRRHRAGPGQSQLRALLPARRVDLDRWSLGEGGVGDAHGGKDGRRDEPPPNPPPLAAGEGFKPLPPRSGGRLGWGPAAGAHANSFTEG